MNRAVMPGLLAGLLVLSTSSVRAQEPTQGRDSGMYKVSKVVPLGAPDRWDYVVFDAPSHRVYVAHGDRLSVVDGRDGAHVGEVTGAPGGTHGVAISTVT